MPNGVTWSVSYYGKICGFCNILLEVTYELEERLNKISKFAKNWFTVALCHPFNFAKFNCHETKIRRKKPEKRLKLKG